MKWMWWLIGIMVMGSLLVEAEEADIAFVGTVESIGDAGELVVRVDEVLATNAESVCPEVKVKVTGGTSGIGVGDRVHVLGFYDVGNCVVTVEGVDQFIYEIPEGAVLERLSQSLQFSGRITRVYEMRDETYCDISVDEVYAVTFQEKEMCGVVTVKIDPVVGEVEEGLKPGDDVEFSGTYDERSCTGSLGWHDDYLRKERGLGVSWVLVVGGFLVYVVMRRVW